MLLAVAIDVAAVCIVAAGAGSGPARRSGPVANGSIAGSAVRFCALRGLPWNLG